MELEQGNSSDVQTESNVSSEPTSSAPAQETSQQQEAAAPQEKEVPFHEHPRFRELVEQKNTYAQKYSQLEESFKQLQAQLQQQPKPQAEMSPEAKILERLKGIDPEFAGFQEQLLSKLSMAEQVQQELQQMKAAREAEQANANFDRLCADNKVPDMLKPFYKQAVANAAITRKASLDQLPSIFKEAHEQLSKSFEEFRRSEREAYVSQKNKDKTPATQSGGTPVGMKSQPAGNKDDVKAAIAAALKAGANI